MPVSDKKKIAKKLHFYAFFAKKSFKLKINNLLIAYFAQKLQNQAMLIDFKIKNFRSFKEETWFTMEAESSSKMKQQNYTEKRLANNSQLRLLKVAMTFGANASGKTNLIRAFHCLLSYINRKPKVNTKVWMYEPFLFDKVSSTESSEFELNFIGPDDIKYNYQIRFNSDFIELEVLTYYPLGRTAMVFERRSNLEQVSTGELGPDFGGTTIKVFNNQLLLSKFGDDEPNEKLSKLFLYFNKYDIINAVNTKHTSFIKSQIEEVSFLNEKLKLRLDCLIRFADTKLKGISIQNTKDENEPKEKDKPSSFTLYGLHSIYENGKETENLHHLPFDNESTGTKVLYTLGGKVLLTLENGGILIVDELDTSLHPFLTRMIVYMFQSEKLNPKNAQLIFTSHDMTLLDRELIRRDQIWVAEKNEMGGSDLFSLQDFDSVREETPFGKWYLSGKFGGLPTMKSIDSMFSDETAN